MKAQNQPEVGVELILVRDEKLLLGRREGGAWSLPVGVLALGESWEDCSVRVAFEETRLVTHNFQFVAATNDLSCGHRVVLFLQSNEISGALSSDSVWHWMPISRLPEDISPAISGLLGYLYTDEASVEPPPFSSELAFEEEQIVTQVIVPESRKNERIRLEATVTASDDNIKLASKLHNISRGGLFLCTEMEFVLGQELDLVITFPNHKVISCKGRVKWRRPPQVATLENPAGIGIELISPTRKVVRMLDEIITQHKKLSFSQEFPLVTGEYSSLAKIPFKKRSQRRSPASLS